MTTSKGERGYPGSTATTTVSAATGGSTRQAFPFAACVGLAIASTVQASWPPLKGGAGVLGWSFPREPPGCRASCPASLLIASLPLGGIPQGDEEVDARTQLDVASTCWPGIQLTDLRVGTGRASVYAATFPASAASSSPVPTLLPGGSKCPKQSRRSSAPVSRSRP